MSSDAFLKALQATGYLGPEGQPAPGLVTNDAPEAARLRAVLKDTRVGLKADAVFSAQNMPTSIFKDAGDTTPSEEQVGHWHEAAWNIGVAPLLWIITPTEVRLYDCYASPWRGTDLGVAASPLDRFDLAADDRLRALDAMCGRLATETGAFWSSLIGKKIDRQYRVDRELLAEINALEGRLTELPPTQGEAQLEGADEIAAARDFAQRLIGRCIFTWYLLDRGIAQPFLPNSLPDDLAAMMATPTSAFDLFDWLRDTFNGDLFPMDDPGAEHMRLGPAHLALARDFIEGRSLVPESHGQGRLFRFRFDAIPVDLVSSIYQQFARSSAEKKARVQGLHYTPVELVHLTLDPVFEDLPATARVIDPTCGSGAFLVEAFRRLIWKRCGDEYATGHAWGFMLGYALALPADAIVQAVNNRLQSDYGGTAALAVAACRHYLSSGRREGRYWLVGDADNTPGRSLFVRLKSTEPAKLAGKWSDAATDEHGDLLDIIARRESLTTLRETLDEARRFLALPRAEPTDTYEDQRPAAAGSPEAARRLFAMSKPIAGTLAEAYLGQRGISGARTCTALRYHPRCWYRSDDDDPADYVRDSWPALIAAVTDEDSTITGAHRTWLDPSGKAKAPISTPRRAMGLLLGNGVRLGRSSDILAAGEGIETMLSLRCVLPTLPMVAALSANHLAALLLPSSLRRLYIARDNDTAGRHAEDSLAERAHAVGVEVLPLVPALGDFNDDLRQLGLSALANGVRLQMDRADAERFLISDRSSRAA